MLELDAEQRTQALEPRIALAKRQVDRITAKQQVGTATSVEAADAQLRLQELTLEHLKAKVELALVQRQILLRRGKD